jgi:hypothetical protein
MIEITRSIAWAAARDAGNRSMRKANRTAWDEEDIHAAIVEFYRLWAPEREITCADTLLSGT